MIPKIIHQIWIQGYDYIPIDLIDYHNSCKKVNDDFEYVIWDNKKIKNFLKEYFDKKYLQTYNNYTIYAQKADFARYTILYVYGGIYLDMDMLCKKNLSDFLNCGVFFTSYIYPNIFKRYLNGIVGARPKHPLFEIILKNIFETKHITKNVTNATGTGMFYKSVQEYIKKNPHHDIHIINQKYLNPCHMFSNEKCKYDCDECYIVHTNYSSWSLTNKFLVKLLKRRKIIILIILLIIIFFLLLHTTDYR